MKQVKLLNTLFLSVLLIITGFSGRASSYLPENQLQIISSGSGDLFLFLVIICLIAVLVIYIYKFNTIKRTFLAEIEQKNHELTDKKLLIHENISFAKRIQDSLVPQPDKSINRLSEHFIIHKAKDTISGDFYWFAAKGNMLFVAVVDCVANGIPGAFMSYFSNQLLDEIHQKEIYEPALVLDSFNEKITEVLNRTKVSSLRDGLNVFFCSIDIQEKVIRFAGSINPLFVYSGNLVNIYRTDKFSIGSQFDKECRFSQQEISVNEGDILYIFSDGFADQIGGPKRKKYTFSKIKDLLVSIANRPLKEQKNMLTKTFYEWKETLPQIDDITVIGLKI
jgi:serine phosphatase RsbU (regulator of sigma subunit)